jgi:pimeloyl-ACP methyl ester carboxylesterase
VRLTHHFVDAERIRLHMVETGSGATVVLLHGFPDSWYSWRRQLSELGACHHVVAFDLPGFNESDPLNRLEDYRAESVADLFAGVLRSMAPVALVGHDWGGMVAWQVAERHPELVSRLVVVNCPHPHLTRSISWRDPRQLLRSWYIGIFRIPILGLAAARLAMPLALRLIVRSQAEREACAAALRRSGLREPLRYYRNMSFLSPSPDGLRLPPTLLIWGERDPFLSRRLADATVRLLPAVQLLRVPRGGHWVHQRQPHIINATINRFLMSGAGA